MGFLKIGTPLSWEEVEQVKSLIRLYGILQFINIYKHNKDRYDENLMFGDEIEYIIIKNNENLKESSALLCASDLIDEMMNLESVIECQYGSHWTPEYSSFNIEGTPSVPFKFDIDSSSFVEDCMRIRRSKLNNVLSALNGVRAITLPCYPNIFLDNSLLMVKRINHENNKKKMDKCAVETIESQLIEKLNLKKKNENNEVDDLRNINLCIEDKKSINDTLALDMDENKSVNFVHSDITFQRTDDFLSQEIFCEDIDGTEIGMKIEQLLEKEKENKGNEKSKERVKENESDLYMNAIKGNLLFECEIFKPENVNEYSNSVLITDMGISPHPRYVTLTKNIRDRRGSKIISFTEIFKDIYTDKLPFWDLSLDKNDKRIFKKIKKKYILDDHLIWNKSMSNVKNKKNTINNEKHIENDIFLEESDAYKIKNNRANLSYVEKKKNNSDEENLMDKVIKNSVYCDLDDENDYIYVYDRKFIEEYSKISKYPIKDYVYLDAMFFGMSMCCQQLTMSFSTIDEARYLYDQLAVIAPLFLALTATTPYLGGFLTETDTRWRVISNSVDCRTENELSYISKPRYSGVSLYISNELPLKNNYYFYNDIDVILDKNVYDKLRKENVDDYLSRHVASLFIRDPIVVFKGSYNENDLLSVQKKAKEFNKNNNRVKEPSINTSINSDNTTNESKNCYENYDSEVDCDGNNNCKNKNNEGNLHSVYLSDNFNFLEDYEDNVLSSHQHFENFQSTNWNSVRFKPPPIIDNHFNSPSSIGWRVEFRTPDIQITDFENSCVVTLIMVLSKFILEKKLNLYIPMSLLEENMFRSANRDAILKEKFYFRKNLEYDTTNNEIEERSLYDIFFNEENGIFFLCSKYVQKKFEEGVLSQSSKNKIDEYIEFIKLRCNGSISTGASYLRNFILNHPSYEKNSYINSKLNYDICKLIADIGKGLIIPQELLGVFVDPYKERIKSDLRQINEIQYLKSLAYKFISGEDYTQYLLLSDSIKQDQRDYYTCTKRTNYEESTDNTLEFGKKLYQLSA